jgi:DNA-binding XRE family transcriptional regulator
MQLINIIYGLRDPRNDVYFYIGKSSVGINRPLSHLVESHSSNIKLWVSELKEKDLNSLIDIIEEVDNLDNLPIREKYWITYYFNLNPFLLNVQSLPKEIEEIRSEKTDEDFDKLTAIINKIPEILKRERIMRGIKQEELSELIGLSKSTISLVEKGSNIKFESIKSYFNGIITKDRITSVNKNRVSTQKNDK